VERKGEGEKGRRGEREKERQAMVFSPFLPFSLSPLLLT
jgi:hypothetical protein